MHHLDLKGIALITIWWYKDASAAPMNGPTQNIHCTKKELNAANVFRRPYQDEV